MTKPSTTSPRPAGQDGVTLVELIVSMVIFAIIGTVAVMFLTTGLGGYLTSRRAAEAGPVAQTALSRISLELRSAQGVGGTDQVTVVDDTSITYESTEAALSGTRMLRYADGELYIQVDGTDYLLLSGIETFTLSVTEDDLNGDAADGDEIATIDLSLTLSAAPNNPFNLRILPRQFIRL